jgi:3-oxoacyl-[acyl-carrier-protein] synthase II
MELTPSGKTVVVTGLGVITGVGTGIDRCWENLIAGKSGIARVTRFNVEQYPSQVGCEIKDFNPELYMDKKEANRNDRYVQIAIGATQMAIKDSGLVMANENAERVGVLIGSGVGGMESIQKHAFTLFEKGPRKMSPFTIPNIIANMAAGMVAIDIGAKGPNFSIVSACASGSHALGEALNTLRRGDADVMIAGGSEAAITELSYGGFCAMKAMSKSFNDRPEASSRPFDANRDGFVMGEGAGILILETLEHAKARGAKIYCEFSGYAANCDAYHITSPDPEGKGLAKCLERAFASASIALDRCDYINAHGTSTPYNDKFESLAVKLVFGEHARKLMVSSTKSMTGHLLGAAGGIEAAFCVKAIETGVVPPTINYETPDPDCDLDYIPNQKRVAKVRVAASNNLGFGGHNASLVFNAHG